MGGVGDTISLSEASRFGRNTAFSLMLKPVGSRCNLRCSYCYYLDKSSIYTLLIDRFYTVLFSVS